jgi:hypothetical protein
MPPGIYDRLYFSEIVYAPPQGRQVAFTLAEQHYIEAIIHAMRCPVIFCIPSLDTVRSNVFNGSKQMEGILEIIEDLWQRYQGLYAKLKMDGNNVMRHAYTVPELTESAIDLCIGYQRRQAERLVR